MLRSLLTLALHCLFIFSIIGQPGMQISILGIEKFTFEDGRITFENTAGNIALGKATLSNITTGKGNIAIGDSALHSSTKFGNSVAIGHAALKNDIQIISRANTAVGHNAGRENTAGFLNSFFGENSGMHNKLGTNNSYFGNNSGQKNTDASHNSFFGVNAGRDNIANNNSFFGQNAGALNSTGESNAFFGQAAGQSNIGGSNNSFFGRAAGADNTGGFFNSFFGKFAGHSNTTANYNSFFGSDCGVNTTTGGGNTFLGGLAGANNTAGSQNCFIGVNAGRFDSVGINNVCIGHSSGQYMTSGSGNIFLGHSSGANELGSNKLYIENSSSSAPLIYGDFTTNQVGINGNLGIGLHTPAHPLHIQQPGILGQQQVMAVLDAGQSKRPILLFTEGGSNLANGMSIEYDGAIGGGSLNRMYINGTSGSPLMTVMNGGQVGIGTSNPSIKLTVDYGSDVGPSSGGYIMTGRETGYNIGIDNNEIMARNNGVVSMLYLQNNGGDTRIGGPLAVVRGGLPFAALHVKQAPGLSEGIMLENDDNSDVWSMRFLGTNNDLYFAFGYISRAKIDDVDGSWDLLSDRAVKKNISYLKEPVLQKLCALRPATYHYTYNSEDTPKSIGFIAQEVRALFPEIVNKDEDEEFYSLNYHDFAVLAVKAIQELKLENDELAQTVQELKKENQRLQKVQDEILRRLEVLAN